MAERPDDLATARMILTRQRRLGEPFAAAWGRMLAALPPIERYPRDAEATERDRTLAALHATQEEWQAAYEGRPALPRPYPSRVIETAPRGADRVAA